MSNTLNTGNPIDTPVLYQIEIEGEFGAEWSAWFGDMLISHTKNGDTLLTGPIVDQAALYGLLKKVRDLGMSLVSVIRLHPGERDASDVEQSSSFQDEQGVKK